MQLALRCKQIDMADKLTIRQFDVREANWATEANLLSNLRRLVFVVEQKVPEEEEWDDQDEHCWHWIASGPDGLPIGTGRLMPDGQIGRMAVLGEFRGAGVGAAILEQAIDKARHLGFEEVYLHAQVHALGFYQRAGFSAVGNEFDEAGILHQKMTMKLSPLDDNVQRVSISKNKIQQPNQGDEICGQEPVDDPGINPSANIQTLSVRNFDVREVAFSDYANLIRNIRELVFVVEQGKKDQEINAGETHEDKNRHWIAEDKTGQLVGVICLSESGHISRLAVLSDYRRQGIGRSLLELAVTKATRIGLGEVSLVAPGHLDHFFQQAGFSPDSESVDLGSNQTYRKELKLEDVHGIPQRAQTTGEHFSDTDTIYELGTNKNLIMLRREEDFRNIILEMAGQAITSIRIYSPVLEHKLFNNQELREICSALARKNRYTSIEILLHDPHRIIKHSHALLEISRKLSSSIKIKIVHPDLRRLNHEYLLIDDCGVIYRLDHEKFDGYANFADVTDCSRLGRQFTAAWESGLIDPNLRQMRL